MLIDFDGHLDTLTLRWKVSTCNFAFEAHFRRRHVQSRCSSGVKRIVMNLRCSNCFFGDSLSLAAWVSLGWFIIFEQFGVQRFSAEITSFRTLLQMLSSKHLVRLGGEQADAIDFQIDFQCWHLRCCPWCFERCWGILSSSEVASISYTSFWSRMFSYPCSIGTTFQDGCARFPFLLPNFWVQESVLNTTAFVLGLALSDVRAYRLEAVKASWLMVNYLHFPWENHGKPWEKVLFTQRIQRRMRVQISFFLICLICFNHPIPVGLLAITSHGLFDDGTAGGGQVRLV